MEKGGNQPLFPSAQWCNVGKCLGSLDVIIGELPTCQTQAYYGESPPPAMSSTSIEFRFYIERMPKKSPNNSKA